MVVRLASAVPPPTAAEKVVAPEVLTVRELAPLTVSVKETESPPELVRVVLAPSVTAPV